MKLVKDINIYRQTLVFSTAINLGTQIKFFQMRQLRKKCVKALTSSWNRFTLLRYFLNICKVAQDFKQTNWICHFSSFFCFNYYFFLWKLIFSCQIPFSTCYCDTCTPVYFILCLFTQFQICFPTYINITLYSIFCQKRIAEITLQSFV